MGEQSTSKNAGTRQNLRANTSHNLIYPKSKKTKPSLWAEAYERLRQEHDELSKEFEARLGIGITCTGNDDDSDLNNKIHEIQQKAVKAITTARESNDLSKTTAKIKRCFERSITIIIGAKDLIASISSANPYAAMDWSGVSLLLPVRHIFGPILYSSSLQKFNVRRVMSRVLSWSIQHRNESVICQGRSRRL